MHFPIFHASFICRCFKREFPLVVDMQRIDPIKLEISGRNLGARTTATHWHRISSRSSESELRLCWDTVTWPPKKLGVCYCISVWNASGECLRYFFFAFFLLFGGIGLLWVEPYFQKTTFLAGHGVHRQFDLVDVDAFGCWGHVKDTLEVVRPGRISQIFGWTKPFLLLLLLLVILLYFFFFFLLLLLLLLLFLSLCYSISVERLYSCWKMVG